MPRTEEQNREKREAAREAILAAALSVFGEKGFDGATTAEVAKAAGVSKGLVFNYFPTKDALLQAMLEQVLGEALGQWEKVSWEGPPETQLACIVDGGIAQVCARPEFHRLYFSLVLQPGGSKAVAGATAAAMSGLQGYYGRTTALMRALGSDDPDLDSKLFQIALNGLAHSVVSSPGLASAKGKPVLDALKRRLVERFLPSRTSRKGKGR